MKNIDIKKVAFNNLYAELVGFLDSLPEPRLVIDLNYKIVGANKAYQIAFGNNKSLLGRKCHEVSHHYLTPCDQHGEACPLSSAKETKETCREFHVHFTSRGQQHVSVELTPILDENGIPILFVETLSAQTHSSAISHHEGLVGKSQAFLKMLGLVERAAPSDVAILLLGESGTGKEEVSHLIHKKSLRSSKAFVIVECSGLTDSLFESEMFGHEKGSFTGAIQNKKGLVEVADGGTLFLDEIGDIPLNLQVKLLRLIESRTYRKVGGTEVIKCDFRLICATHRNLEEMVKDGTFRADLYFRISPFQIALPSLRERKDDIALLAQSLLKRIAPNRELTFSETALKLMEELSFTGNIRELRNMLERASLMTDGTKIQVEHLVDDACKVSQESGKQINGCSSCRVVQPLEDIESKYLQCIMREHGEDLDYLSRALGVSKRTLYRMINKIKEPSIGKPYKSH
jgi:two-component system, NtrC family, response regulator HydG